MTKKIEADVVSRRAELYSLLGDLPERDKPISAEKLGEHEHDKFLLEEWLLDLNGIELVPAYVARPRGADAADRLPAILYSHVHGGVYRLGKNELIEGWEGLQQPPYAVPLTERGFLVLCIDAWNFGARHRQTESAAYKEMLWRGRVLWGMMVYDSLRALDYLAGRDDVDAARIGAMGMSMGSTISWWVAALDERVRAVVDICCLTDYDALIEDGGLDRHGIYYYVPRLLKYFTSGQINALIAPRPHLGLVGTLDPLTPVAGVDKIDAELRDAYARAGAPENWKLARFNVAHEETPAMRAMALEWMEWHLKG